MDDDTESVIGVSASASASGSVTGLTTDELIWPSMQDLNTRLRRVITSYQRNYKKEELKQQQKAKVSVLKFPLSYSYLYIIIYKLNTHTQFAIETI